MEGRLKSKVIVFAGAGGGGLAHRYAAEGASVLLGDFNRDAVEATVSEITAAGGTAIGTTLDGADESSINAAVALAVERFGGLDGFHANFASFVDGGSGDDVLGMPMDVFDEMVRINMRGFVLCTRAAFMGETVRLSYSMSKLATHALVRHVANRFGRDGIRANAIPPGLVTHAGLEAVMESAGLKAIADGIPVGRLGRPADIAAMGALLLSDEGSYISGQVLSVDGGSTMRQ